jgi:TolA-binding protein
MFALPIYYRPAAALLCVLTPGLRAQEGDLAERLYLSGERAYAAKSYKEATETWQQLLQSNPTSSYCPKALLKLAQHQIETERKPEAALPFLDRLKADYLKSPEAAEGMLLSGKLLLLHAHRPGELKDAMAEFNRVLDLYPDAPACAEARFELGRAWNLLGQWGRALPQFLDAFRIRYDARVAPRAMLAAAETMDLLGDLPGCLRMLQQLRTEFPALPEAQEATWRMAVRVKHRLQRPALKLEGPWPQGRVKWLKTPLLLQSTPEGDLLIFQNDLDRTFRLRGPELTPVGPSSPSARALVSTGKGTLWTLTKNALIREETPIPQPIGTLNAISGAVLDAWNQLWIADAKVAALTVLAPDGTTRTVGSPPLQALAAQPGGGMVAASDSDRKLLFLDQEGQPRHIIPYGKDLPAAFRTVTALGSDGAGQVAALVDGGDYGEGVLIFGPDGNLLRQVQFKPLGISGRITSVALDRSGALILCDRRNDVLLRLN